MVNVMIRQTVADYAQWKQGFDNHASAREEAGSRGGHVFRSLDDPNQVVILMRWDSIERARSFYESATLRQVRAAAGVTVAQREVTYLEQAADVTV
jgi:heme-degrading monooxygenase HmoA